MSALVFLLGHGGFLRVFETSSLDTWLRLKAPQPVEHVVVVGITECDYRELFGATSPLDPVRVAKVLGAIAAGQPTAIGVDLDTGHPSFAAMTLPSGGPPVVWGRAASSGDGGPCDPSDSQPEAASAAGHRSSDDEPQHEHVELRPGSVLGGAAVPADVKTGIALLPQDPDGIIRRYRRVFQTTDGPLDSLPWALVRHCPAGADVARDETHEDLVLNFAGDRYAIPRYSAQDVLTGAKGEAWAQQGPLRGKIVLLGGLYRAARDEYLTPLGPMAGVELVGQAIESDLTGGGIRATNEALMITFEILGGILMVWIYYRFHLRLALLLSLIGIPLLALGSSYASFSTLGHWASFVPLLVAVLLHQIHHHAMEYRRLYLGSLGAHQSVAVVPAASPTAASPAADATEPPDEGDGGQ